MTFEQIVAAALTWVAYLVGAAACTSASVVDIRTHRLPDRLVLPVYPAALGLLGAAAWVGGRFGAFSAALVGGAVMFAFYFVLRWFRPAGMGGGDVKLAGVLGIYLGYAGWSPLVLGAMSAFLLGGVFAVLLVVTRRGSGSTAIPFGPFMVAGAAAGLVLGAAAGT